MKQIGIVIGIFIVLLLTRADAGKWYKSDDGYNYFIETEHKIDWFELGMECRTRNAFPLGFETRASEKRNQLYNLVAKVVDKTSIDFWVAGIPIDEIDFCPSLWGPRYPACIEMLGYICEGDPPPEPEIVTKSNKMEINQPMATGVVHKPELNQTNVSFEAQTQLLKNKTKAFADLKQTYENQTIQLNSKNLELEKLTADLEILRKSYEAQTKEMEAKSQVRIALANHMDALKMSYDLQSLQLKAKTEELEWLKKINTSNMNEFDELKKVHTLQATQMVNITGELQDVKKSYDQHKNLLIDKIVELEEMKKSCKLQIDQVSQEKENEISDQKKLFEANILAKTKECDDKLEYLKKSKENLNEETEELTVVKKNYTIPNKYYNIIFRNG